MTSIRCLGSGVAGRCPNLQNRRPSESQCDSLSPLSGKLKAKPGNEILKAIFAKKLSFQTALNLSTGVFGNAKIRVAISQVEDISPSIVCH